MDKNVWKKIIESMPDEELVHLANACSIKVQGFRKINISTLKLCKPLLLTETLKSKNLRKIISFFNKMSEVDDKEDIDYYRQMNIDQLISVANNGTPHFEILAALYSSEKEELINLAKDFEKTVDNKLQTEEHMQERKNVVQNQHQEEEQIKTLREIVIELEGKVKKYETKNKDLHLNIKKIREEYQEAKANWKLERDKFVKIEKTLKQEILAYQNKNSELTDIIEKNETNHRELINQKNAEISHLNAMILNSKKTEAVDIDELNVIDAPNIQDVQKVDTVTTRKIALIGNPKNQNIVKNKRIKFSIFEASEIERIIEESTLENFEEIWMLTYKVASTRQKLVSENVKREIKEISTFMDLKSLVEKG